MIRCFFALVLVMLLLCSCSGQMLPDESSPMASPEISADAIPNSPLVVPPPQPPDQSQAHTSEPDNQSPDAENEVGLVTTATPDDAPGSSDSVGMEYARIISFYREFLLSLKDNNSDTQEAVYELYDKISSELSIEPGTFSTQEDYGLWSSCVEARHSNLGYALRDINNDGIPELFIISEEYSIHAIYSLYEGAPVLIGGFWPRHSCAVDDTGILYIWSSGGAGDWNISSNLFVPGNAELQLIEMVGVESFDEQTNEVLPSLRYYRVVDGNKTTISQEEFESAYDVFPGAYPEETTKSAGLVFAPM